MDPVPNRGPRRRTLRRYWPLIAGATLSAAALGYAATVMVAPTYQATASILLSEAEVVGESLVGPERRVVQEAGRVTSREVLSRAVEVVGGGTTVDQLRRRIAVRADPSAGEIVVTADAGGPGSAADVANSVAAAYREATAAVAADRIAAATKVLDAEIVEARQEIDALEAVSADGDPATGSLLDAALTRLASLEMRVTDIEVDAALFGDGVTRVEQAIPPSEPIGLPPASVAAVAGVACLLLASLFAWWRAGAVDTARFGAPDVLGAPLLAEIPLFEQRPDTSIGHPTLGAEATEAYQFLLSSFESVIGRSGARSILVTSAAPGDGKSLTAMHLARALAMQGRDVTLVDADLRVRGLTQLLRAEGRAGLVDVAQGAPLDGVIRRYRIDGEHRLPLVPTGDPPQHVTSLLGTNAYREALTKITADSDLTIIDCGPILTVSDAGAVAGLVDGILLVVDAATPPEQLFRARERLRPISTPLLGYVLNRLSDAGAPAYRYDKSA